MHNRYDNTGSSIDKILKEGNNKQKGWLHTPDVYIKRLTIYEEWLILTVQCALISGMSNMVGQNAMHLLCHSHSVSHITTAKNHKKYITQQGPVDWVIWSEKITSVFNYNKI